MEEIFENEIVENVSQDSVSGNDVGVGSDPPYSADLLSYLQHISERLDDLQESEEVSNEYLETVSEIISEDNSYNLFDKPLAEYSVLEGMTLLSVFFLLALVVWKVLETLNWRR